MNLNFSDLNSVRYVYKCLYASLVEKKLQIKPDIVIIDFNMKYLRKQSKVL